MAEPAKNLSLVVSNRPDSPDEALVDSAQTGAAPSNTAKATDFDTGAKDDVDANVGTDVGAHVDTDAVTVADSDSDSDADADADADAGVLVDVDDTDDNRVRRTVQEFCDLQKEMHDLRENLVALGAPFQTIGVMVEMGFNNRLDEQEKLIVSCLSTSKVNNKIDADISRRFRQQLLQLTELERDMAHARKLARQSGFVLPALNALTNMIRQNPGDGGEKVVNSFLAYALAAGIKLDGIQEILDVANAEEKSVLPVIDIDEPDPAVEARYALVRDVILGSLLTIGVMWLIV